MGNSKLKYKVQELWLRFVTKELPHRLVTKELCAKRPCRFETACRLVAIAMAMLLAAPAAVADDTGLVVEAGVSKKISKTVSAGLDAEFRTRNDFRTVDRFSIGADVSYKPLKWLKISAGYILLIDNEKEDISRNEDGSYNNWRPSYYGLRHRLNVSLTGEYKPHKRVKISLRERYQYTHRGTHDTRRYDFDNEWWEDVTVKARDRHMLRSRLQVEWDIPKCKFDPFASVEIFNDRYFDKARFTLGGEISINKTHTFGAYYRYQLIGAQEDEEPNFHYFGLTYKFKF